MMILIDLCILNDAIINVDFTALINAVVFKRKSDIKRTYWVIILIN